MTVADQVRADAARWSARYVDQHPCDVFAWTAFVWMWKCIGWYHARGYREKWGAP